MTSSYPERYQHAVQLFNEGDYFETHEELEDIWNDTSGEERLYYQAILQAAVGLHHYINGNWQGALSLNRNYKAKIDRLSFDHFMGLDIRLFVEQMDRCFAPLVAAEDKSTVEIDTLLIPKIPFYDAAESG